jgi:predicted acylesterase/phospholipase RssA
MEEAATPASRAASRVEARPQPRLGLAFGGGLPFGAAAIGVIDVFEQHGIRIDCLAGTSMGSIIGLLYAYGYTPRELERHFEDFFKVKRLLPILLRDVRLRRSGFVQGNHIIKTLGKLIPESTTFEDLRIPFAVPAADLLTGQEVVFRSGPVLPAIRASISMPGIFTPVEYDGTYLVDGAMISPIPVHLLDLLGAEIKIPMRAVRQRPHDVRQRIVAIHEANRHRHPRHGPPDVLRLMWRSLSLILQDQFAELLLGQYDVYIKPEIPFDYASSPDKVRDIIEVGRQEAERLLPDVLQAIRKRQDAAAAAPAAAAAEGGAARPTAP